MLRLALAVLLTVGTPALAWASCGAESGGIRQCTVSGRDYWLHVPSSGSGPRPLVVLLHGGELAVDVTVPPQIRAAVNAATSPMETTADSLNIMVAYPRSSCNPCGPGGTYQWNFAPDPTGTCAVLGLCSDDVVFVNAVITDIKATFSTDATKVALAGMSGGGTQVLRMLCEPSGNSHATVGWAIAATLTPNSVSTCTNATTTQLYIINGTQDTAAPYTPAPGAGMPCGFGLPSICTDTSGVKQLPVGYGAYQVIALGARGGSRNEASAWSATVSWAPSLNAANPESANGKDGNCFSTTHHLGAKVSVRTIGPGVIAPFLIGTRPDGGCFVNDGVAGTNFDGGGHRWPSTATYGLGKGTYFFNLNAEILDTVAP
jgi:poly(3-hydroxybutyrate) depolymerase